MFLTKKHISRRTVLRGAGATIALPLLNAMVPAATALSATAARPTQRLGFIYVPHGAVMARWSPKETGTNFKLPQILESLEPYRKHVTVVSGLRNKAGESSSPHGIMAGTWLNCTAPAPTQKPQAGISADQVAALKIGQGTPFPSLELCTEAGGPCDPSYGCSYGHTISFRTPNQPLPMEYNPRKVFYDLFGQGDNNAERAQIVKENRSLLDEVSGDLSSLRRKLGADDQAMLGVYLDSVREVERRIQQIEDHDVASMDLPSTPVGVPNDFNTHLDLMYDLMALAYQANLTRVITFMMGKEVSMRTFTNIGVSDAFHPLSHHGNNPANLDRLALVQAWHAKVFSRFVGKLAAMPDGDGSMLDHMTLLYGGNMSDSNRHNNDPLPAVVLGKACGGIKGGQHLHYPQDTPLANLLVALLNKSGIPTESLGNSTGELSEI